MEEGWGDGKEWGEEGGMGMEGLGGWWTDGNRNGWMEGKVEWQGGRESRRVGRDEGGEWGETRRGVGWYSLLWCVFAGGSVGGPLFSAAFAHLR
jgi:hypothetical protein